MASIGEADSATVPLLLVTANVGSVFEDPDRLLRTWIDAFVAKVLAVRPLFIALHLQEVGGKTYEKSMEYVQDFIRILCETAELQRFGRIRVYLDEDYTSAEHFTALGNLYFLDDSLADVRIWNFLTHGWEPVPGKSVHTGNIEAVATKEKAKFPQHFFPECKWSRKGFLRTRWWLSGTCVDLVNIHLFHDASNLAACEEYPSVYCKSRRRALVHTMERLHTDRANGVAPYFVFGDFNFRCDTEGVVRRLGDELTVHRLVNARNDFTKVQYRNAAGETVLTIGKKEFTHSEHQTAFRAEWFRQFNREMEPLADVLLEYPITFPPSYPYEEEPTLPQHYMTTRCPAWCDRILMSADARDLIVPTASVSDNDDDDNKCDYNVIGDAVCMGDHKPVYLSIRLATQKGTIRCCSCSDQPPQPFATLPHDLYDTTTTTHPMHINQTQHYHTEDNNTAHKPQFACRCLYASPRFCSILAECKRFNRRHSRAHIGNIGSADAAAVVVAVANGFSPALAVQPKATVTTASIEPPAIAVINADNEPICMCSLYASNDNVRHLVEPPPPPVDGGADVNDGDGPTQTPSSIVAGAICTVCRNTIRLVSAEPRRTLIAKRLTLSRDIIVNRVDTHYLSLNGYGGGGRGDPMGGRHDPYTPESVESHSPMPGEMAANTEKLGYDGVSEAEPEEDEVGDTVKNRAHSDEINRNTIAATVENGGAPHVATTKKTTTTVAAIVSPTPSRGVSPRALKLRLEDLQWGPLAGRCGGHREDDDSGDGEDAGAGEPPMKTKQQRRRRRRGLCDKCRIL